MESSQHLAIESFSQSWLKSISSSLRDIEEPFRPSFDGPHEANFGEVEQRRRKLNRTSFELQNFNFDVPISQSSGALVHADQLFADGIIRPFFHHSSPNPLDLVPARRASFSLRALLSAVKVHCHFFRRWKQVLQKCLEHMRPVCHSVKERRSIRVTDIDRSAWEVDESRRYSPHGSLRRRITYSFTDCCDVESSIYEAVLHCKRSMEK